MRRQRVERIRQQRLQDGIADAERRGASGALLPARERAWLEADLRRKELAFDPDTRSFKIAEAEAALRAEGSGAVVGPIRRSGFSDLGEGGADYVDGAGRLWDVKDASAGVERILGVARGGEM